MWLAVITGQSSLRSFEKAFAGMEQIIQMSIVSNYGFYADDRYSDRFANIAQARMEFETDICMKLTDDALVAADGRSLGRFLI